VRHLRDLLFLRPGELGRAWPFFGLYLLLFGAFSLADGLSLALFVETLGANALPWYYGVTAGVNVVLIGVYVLVAERVGSLRMFEAILGAVLAVYFAAWLVLSHYEGASQWYGALFVAREVAFTLVLMHFGTYLQHYFTRDELNRVLPVVYAGGRVGGIAGGAILQHLSARLGPLDLIPVFLGICVVCMVCMEVISRWMPLSDTPAEDKSAPEAHAGDLEEAARTSLGGFLRFVWASPLLFWTSVSSALFMTSRWFLNFRYNQFFGEWFDGPADMAAFLGRYTQVALVLSLVIQLLVVNRLVARLGARGAYLGYAVLVFLGALVCIPGMTLATALFARFLETELRLGLRNPLMQMITNTFSRPLRIRIRAWTMGLLTPMGTGLASGLLGLLGVLGASAWSGWVGGGVGLLFLLSAVGLHGGFRGRRKAAATDGSLAREPHHGG
jgi:ATP/ADP translocase